MKKGMLLLLTLCSLMAKAQIPGGGSRGGQGTQNMNMGRFYGKIIDSITGKPVDAASVQLIQNRFDTVSKKRKDYVIGGQLTRANGEFSLESLPIMGNFRLKITAIGYKTYERPVKFDMKAGSDFSQMMNNVDKDLGNIKMDVDTKTLEAVTVTGTKPFMQMGVDRRIFNVERSLVSTGQTATELMKVIPGIQVDIDGNVTLRNASPTIFVDGRPTTLTLDQIPSDAIQSVEIITNPSAKFDASGGTAGILNIVLKKNRKAGYNGNLRAGVDSRGKFNGGADINVKQGKVNVFASVMVNQRKSIGENASTRENIDVTPHTFVYQNSNPISNGYFGFGRAGLDYFINNHNTITISGTYVRGRFNNDDLLKTLTDSTIGVVRTNYSERTQHSVGEFRNVGAALGYKRLFTKAGMELTSDFNYNHSNNDNFNNLSTQYFDNSHNPAGKPFVQKQDGSGHNNNYTFQVDFVDPLGEKSKFEAGVRAAIRDVQNENLNYIEDPVSGDLIPVYAINANYKYTDRVLAAYGTYSNVIGKKFTYQVGLRVESSKYDGKLLNTDSSFSNSFPFSIFPSTFLTYKLSESQDLQFSYSRRINRPNFFQLMPFYDYTDTLNISRGNPGLKPEFTNSFEFNYNKNFKKNHSLLLSAYYKHTTDLITRYQVKETNPITGKPMIVNTFVNANSSQAYGLEATAKDPIASWLDLTTNLNVYNSSINGSNLSSDLNNSLWSFFAKMNANVKLPKNWSVQLSGDYRSKSILPQSGSSANQGGGGGRPGGGGFGGFVQTTAQGYINPAYGVDMAIRKDFMKDKRASITLSVNDVFKTRVYSTHSESPYFYQDITRRRDWQVFRVNFAWRFGKFDVSLFKRKNTRSGMEGMQEGAQQMQ